MENKAQFFKYIRTVQCSKQRIWIGFVVRRDGLFVRATKVSVISGNAIHALYAVFFTTPNMDEVTSQPVNEWKRGSVLQVQGPMPWCDYK